MAAEHRGKSSRVTQFQAIEEDITFPTCCDRCLGPSNMLRMTKEIGGKRCGVCQKPFTNFKWHNGAKPKSTMICRACSVSRGNKCQSCLGQMNGSKQADEEQSKSNKLSGARRERDEADDASGVLEKQKKKNEDAEKLKSTKAVVQQQQQKKMAPKTGGGGFGFDWMNEIS